MFTQTGHSYCKKNDSDNTRNTTSKYETILTQEKNGCKLYCTMTISLYHGDFLPATLVTSDEVLNRRSLGTCSRLHRDMHLD